MNRLMKVARQEFRMTAVNRAFVIITIIGPILILAISVVPGVLSMHPTVQAGSVIEIVGARPQLLAALSTPAAREGILLRQEPDAAVAIADLLGGSAAGIVELPPGYSAGGAYRYISRTGTDVGLSESVRRIIGAAIVSERLSQAGFDTARLIPLIRQPSMSVERVTRDGTVVPQNFTAVLFTTIGFVMLIYMTVMLYGQMIGRSVVAEKTSKTVEIMLSSVRPYELLFGKILGKGGAGLLQYAFWIAVAFLLRTLIGPRLGLPVSAALSTSNLAYLVLFFLLAFFLYAGAYGVIGAAANDEQQVGQMAMPLVLFLVIPLTAIGYLVTNPDAPFTLFLSYFPMTSPVVMLMRIVIETPPFGEIALSIAILLASIVVIVALAAKVFRVAILLTGTRMSLAAIVRLLRS